jgi:hypothetical protein
VYIFIKRVAFLEPEMGSFGRLFAALMVFSPCLALLSCGGSSSQKPVPDYSLSATPASITLVPGGAGSQLTVSVSSINGMTGTVTVAISGLPSGVAAQPTTLSLAPGSMQNVTLTAAATATAGAGTLTLTGTSGMLIHAATVMLSVSAPPPDYTLTLSPTSLTNTAGAAASQINISANAVNGFNDTVVVAITGLPSGTTASPLTLNLVPGTPQNISLTTALTAPGSMSTVTFTGTSGSLTHSASLALTVVAAPMTNAPDVTTYHYNAARDGLNPAETILTPNNVSATQFGKIGFDAVDGRVDAEPLYLPNVIIGGQYRNVLYVATEHDSLYAFDADTGVQIWKATVLGNNETTSDNHSCSQITPEIGISSTPVIDRKQGANGTIFVVGMTKDAGSAYHQRLHALDLSTGVETSASPTEITATYPGTGDNTQNGNVVFNPAQYAERAALLLLNGNVYTAWTSHCDIGLYTGWVIAYGESTLQQTQVLNLTPNGNKGSVWMSGDGMAADSAGNIFLLDANGTFDSTLDANGFPSKSDYGSAMVKLSSVNGKLAVADYFATYNTVAESNADLDLGSGGELLLPDQLDAHGVVRHLIVGAGKDRNIFLADRDNMGKFNPSSASPDSNIYQKLPGAMSGQVFSTPAYFNGVVYYSSDGDTLKAFLVLNAVMATTPSSQSTTRFPHPGPTPSISSDGPQNGIVWALESSTSSAGVLHAYDAANLAHELYNSNQAASGRDSFGNGNKFITPLIVNGKVYVGTPNGVAVFGLLQP